MKLAVLFTVAAATVSTASIVFAETPVTHSVLAQDRGRIALVDKQGKVTWQTPLPGGTAHDIALLPNGNILVLSGPRTVVELDKSGKEVWRYEAKPKPGYDGRVEVHAFQRLPRNRTMVAESGNRRIVEVDREGRIVAEVPLTVEKPDPHRDTRLARKLPNGNYLVCHEGDGTVREYDRTGKVVWSYRLDLNNRPRTPHHDGHGTEVFSALRLRNGNTLIGGGNANRVIEVNPAGKIVWSVEQEELPGVRLAWVTTLQALPNGNVIIGNTHAGPNQPQLIEVTRDKKVVWTFHDWTTFGNDTAAALVTDVKDVLR
jgi:outer membrane protein assembly factor BamB